MKARRISAGRRYNRGFTLVEVIIAIAVLGIMAVPVFSCLNFCMVCNMRSKANSMAASAAQSVMEYYKAMDYHEIEYIIESAGSGAAAGSCTVYYFLNDRDIANLSKVSEMLQKCCTGEGCEGFEEMDAMAALKGIEYKYAVKVILSKENRYAGSARTISIDVMLWCRNNRYTKNIEIVSLKGE